MRPNGFILTELLFCSNRSKIEFIASTYLHTYTHTKRTKEVIFNDMFLNVWHSSNMFLSHVHKTQCICSNEQIAFEHIALNPSTSRCSVNSNSTTEMFTVNKLRHSICVLHLLLQLLLFLLICRLVWPNIGALFFPLAFWEFVQLFSEYNNISYFCASLQFPFVRFYRFMKQRGFVLVSCHYH